MNIYVNIMVTRRHSKKAGNSKRRHSKSRKGGFLGMSRGPPEDVFTPESASQLHQALGHYQKFGKGSNFWYKRRKYELGRIGDWDVSNVTDFTGMFRGLDLNQLQTWIYRKDFNHDINNWDVSNVTTMEAAFENCVNFNKPLDKWNVSNVTNMSKMFHGATAFNQPLANWDVSNVTDMSRMFDNAKAFNKDISGWKVNDNVDMTDMFEGSGYTHAKPGDAGIRDSMSERPPELQQQAGKRRRRKTSRKKRRTRKNRTRK